MRGKKKCNAMLKEQLKKYWHARVASIMLPVLQWEKCWIASSSSSGVFVIHGMGRRPIGQMDGRTHRLGVAGLNQMGK
jgi:hypothetical protein